MGEDKYIDHWQHVANENPNDPMFNFPRRIGGIYKVVFSKKLKTPRWSGALLASGDWASEIAALNKKHKRSLLAFGGAGFASSLIKAGVVDEFQFFISPTAIGKGLTIFEKKAADSTLKMREAAAYDCGTAVQRYFAAIAP